MRLHIDVGLTVGGLVPTGVVHSPSHSHSQVFVSSSRSGPPYFGGHNTSVQCCWHVCEDSQRGPNQSAAQLHCAVGVITVGFAGDGVERIEHN